MTQFPGLSRRAIFYADLLIGYCNIFDDQLTANGILPRLGVGTPVVDTGLAGLALGDG